MIIDDGKPKSVPNPLAGQSGPGQTPDPAAVPAAPALATVPINELMALIQLMGQREARAAKAEEQDHARKEARRLQYENNRQDDEKSLLLRQASCRHLKGGKNRRRNAAVDHIVYMHTFIHGETYIKCQSCGMKWRPTDTVQFVVRNGKIYKNHTKKGWAEALEMAANSTNASSRSEIPPSQFHNVPKEVSMATPTSVEIDTDAVGEAETVSIV